MEIKNAKKIWLLIIIGAVIEDFILGLRMLNPVLKREALFYIENYSGLYFLLMGMAMSNNVKTLDILLSFLFQALNLISLLIIKIG